MQGLTKQHLWFTTSNASNHERNNVYYSLDVTQKVNIQWSSLGTEAAKICNFLSQSTFPESMQYALRHLLKVIARLHCFLQFMAALNFQSCLGNCVLSQLHALSLSCTHTKSLLPCHLQHVTFRATWYLTHMYRFSQHHILNLCVWNVASSLKIMWCKTWSILAIQLTWQYFQQNRMSYNCHLVSLHTITVIQNVKKNIYIYIFSQHLVSC
jgi:hypothetical protein